MNDRGALTAALSAGWQPIETAPRDGTPVLVYLAAPLMGSRIHTAWFRQNVSIVATSFAFDVPATTHWMPLPSAPDEP